MRKKKSKTTDAASKASSTSKKSPDDRSVYADLMNQINLLNEDQFNTKIEMMMNELNMRSEEARNLVLSKDSNSKKDMLAKYLRSRGIGVHDDPHQVLTSRFGSSKQMSHPDHFADQLNKKDIPQRNMLQILQSIRIMLTTESLAWLEMFLEVGMSSVFTLMENQLALNTFKSQLTTQEIIHECLRSVQAIMNSPIGLKFVMDRDDYLYLVTKCLDPSNSFMMTDANRLVAAISLINYDKTLKSITMLGRERNVNRFAIFVAAMKPGQPISLQISSIVLVNALVMGSEDVDMRFHLRNEMVREGILEQIKSLKTVDIHKLQTQISIFDESMESDSIEFHGKFYDMQNHLNDIDEVFGLIRSVNQKTPVETYFLSILQHLLFIREDTLIRTQYYRLIEEAVSQIVLQKNGTDPDFKCTRFELDVDTLIEQMCNEAMVHEATERMKVSEAKLKEEISAKEDLESKINVMNKEFEEKLKIIYQEKNDNEKKID